MNSEFPFSVLETVGSHLVRARVAAVLHGGRVEVSINDDSAGTVCDVLQTTDAECLLLSPGDDVLVCWLFDASPVILGRVASARMVEARPVPTQRTLPKDDEITGEQVPDTLILEAKHELTLRVGEGSITIREDGKILIKGKDLVSHAQRMNRIKGGAVSIN